MDSQDTIVALSSAPGSGARAIIRLSGCKSLSVIQHSLLEKFPLDANRRALYSGHLLLQEIGNQIPADVYVWPEPKTYTGQLLVEVHTISSPPLVEMLISQFLAAGARAAQPGEFTMRAFLSGKLDLTRAEAVLAVIEAGNRDELKQALHLLAGGVNQPLQELRSDLLNLLADLEAGLDFSDEDIEFVQQKDLLDRLAKGMALVTGLQQQLNRRSSSENTFRVALGGRPNAGKSSLFNSLGNASALVSNIPGTTRDYLSRRIEMEGCWIELVDTAGFHPSGNGIEHQAQELGKEQIERADLVLLCVEAGQDLSSTEDKLIQQKPEKILLVITKCDLHPGKTGAGSFSLKTATLKTSSTTGQGLSQLRQVLADRARSHSRPALAPSLSRCRNHVESCLECLRRAHFLVLEEDPPELVALEIRGALDQLGEMVGAIYTDDLLDRIFSRFCIGK